MIRNANRLGLACVAALLAGAAQGQTFLIDCGPSGGATTSPDVNGNTWNNFSPGGFFRLLDTTGAETGGGGDVTGDGVPDGIGFGGFTPIGAGLVNDPTYGLENPDPLLLGDLAIPSATIDALFRQDDLFAAPETIGLELSNLDQGQTYNIRVFGTRDFIAERVSEYTVTGAGGPQSIAIQTSGPNIGADGVSFGNDNEIAEFLNVVPQADGTIQIEARALSTDPSNSFCYINAISISVAVPVEFTDQPDSTIVDAGQTLAFAAAATNADSYQWRRDGMDLVDDARISGATSAMLSIADAGLGDVGVYTVVATVGDDSAESNGAIAAVRGMGSAGADFNGDSFINFFDVLDFLTVFDAAM